MFTIIDSSNRTMHADLLDGMYWARYDAFVLGRGWRDLARPDGRDIDQFDDEDTVYIVGHEDGRVVCGCRIRPSQKPHLLREAFSHLVSGGEVPEGPNVFECSRLFVERRHPERNRVYIQLLAQTVDWYRANGGDLLTGVIETWWLNSFLSLDFKIAPLGAPIREGRTSIVGVRVVVDDALQANLHGRMSGSPAPTSILSFRDSAQASYVSAANGEKAA